MKSSQSSASSSSAKRGLRPLPAVIFASRWLQLPLYLGLIVAQAVYVFHFWVELAHLIEAAFGSSQAVAAIATSVQPCDAAVALAKGSVCAAVPTKLTETLIMLLVLGLWRHVYRRFPLRYDPLYWGAVFPLGMYTACTVRLSRAVDAPYLLAIPQVTVYLALAAWSLAFVGMVAHVGRRAPARAGGGAEIRR